LPSRRRREPRGDAVRAAIPAFRDGLLAEHLGVAPGEVAAAIARQGSLAGAIEALRRVSGKTLRPLEVTPPNEAERMLAGSHLLDPERPGQGERRITHLAKRLLLAPRRALVDAGRTILDSAAFRRGAGGGCR
jgi:hypothetical protein